MIVGGGLVLRPAARGDRQRWLELSHDPDELRWGLPVVVPVPADVGALDDHVASSQERWTARQPGGLVVAREDDPGRFLGFLAWRHDTPPMLRVADVGYGVHPDSRRRGVASGGLRLLTRWLTLDDGGPRLARVQLDHAVDHLASYGTALAAGLAREGVRRAFLPLRDEHAPSGVRRHDVCLHGFVPPGPVD